MCKKEVLKWLLDVSGRESTIREVSKDYAEITFSLVGNKFFRAEQKLS